MCRFPFTTRGGEAMTRSTVNRATKSAALKVRIPAAPRLEDAAVSGRGSSVSGMPESVSALKSLLRFLLPKGGMALMVGGFDETGTHVGSPITCVAGYIF